MWVLRKGLELCPGKTVMWAFACMPLNDITVSLRALNWDTKQNHSLERAFENGLIECYINM